MTRRNMMKKIVGADEWIRAASCFL
ncbi:GNAT family N-acetyltransferase, partial [Enterococcus faecium]